MTTCKSPRKVLREAWKTAQDALPPYAHRYSPKKFTQHQLLACLVLKAHLRTDYRGLWELLRDCPDLCRSIELKAVPHWTTLQKASRRLLTQPRVDRLLETTVKRIMRRRRRVRTAAGDSTGFEATRASRYYVWRARQRGKPPKHMTYRRFPKLDIIADASNHVILSAVPGIGPRPDVGALERLLSRLTRHPILDRMVLDAGYDSEPNHRLLREDHGVRSVIPPESGRPSPSGKLPAGKYRRLMKQRFDAKTYRQRSQVETVISMLKRNLGDWVRGVTYGSQRRELQLKAITHNILIAYRWVFYRAQKTAFLTPPEGAKTTFATGC